MKIAQLSEVTFPTPPYGGAGGIERVVSVLTEGLVKRGHDVTLFATKDSETSANLVYLEKNGINSAPERKDEEDKIKIKHARNAFKYIGEFDIMHNHMRVALLAERDKKYPLLTTVHDSDNEKERKFYGEHNNDCFFSAISYAQQNYHPTLNWNSRHPVVYNGIEVEKFPFSENKDDYLLFLSRLSPVKGPGTAIKVAKDLGMKLIIAGDIIPSRRDWFDKEVSPHINGKKIDYVGEVNEEQKKALMVDAKAFIFPISWGEGFGLVLAEAMACGTPVISFDKGAVSELVEHGKTGYVVRDVEEMKKAVYKLDKINPADCRRRVEENFSADRMVDAYVDVYSSMLEKSKQPSLSSQ